MGTIEGRHEDIKSRVIWPYGEIVKILVFSKGCVKVKI